MATISNECANALGNQAEMRYKSNVRAIERAFDTFRRSTTMSAMTIDLAPTASRSPNGEQRSLTEAPTGTRPAARSGRGSARARSPQARPGRVIPAPSLQSAPSRAVRGCVVHRPVTASEATAWQLTDRGIAVVLVSALMIVIAALAVIGLTALRVTGDSYQAYGQSRSAQR
jgi:hypothetical protein